MCYRAHKGEKKTEENGVVGIMVDFAIYSAKTYTSPGLLADGPGMFSVNGVATTTLMLNHVTCHRTHELEAYSKTSRRKDGRTGS